MFVAITVQEDELPASTKPALAISMTPQSVDVVSMCPRDLRNRDLRARARA